MFQLTFEAIQATKLKIVTGEKKVDLVFLPLNLFLFRSPVLVEKTPFGFITQCNGIFGCALLIVQSVLFSSEDFPQDLF